MQNGDISSTEFDKVLQERKEGKEDFLRKIANTSDIQCVNTI